MMVGLVGLGHMDWVIWAGPEVVGMLEMYPDSGLFSR